MVRISTVSDPTASRPRWIIFQGDRRGHLPRLPISIYKLFFLCRANGERHPPDELETLDVGWFAVDALPELSAGRVNRWELERVLAHHHDPARPTEFD